MSKKTFNTKRFESIEAEVIPEGHGIALEAVLNGQKFDGVFSFEDIGPHVAQSHYETLFAAMGEAQAESMAEQLLLHTAHNRGFNA